MTEREYMNVVNLERLRQAAESLRQTIGLTRTQTQRMRAAQIAIGKLVEDFEKRVDRQTEATR